MTSDRSDPRISVVIPTLNRPRPLARALASVLAQTGLGPDEAVEVVVVDNSPDGNAAGQVAGLLADLAAAAAIRVHYRTVPEPGVASARNAGVAFASGEWIAFLDDDEEAGPTWLASLLATVRASGADAAFGPVRARSEDGRELGPMAPYFSRALACQDGTDITDRAAYLGTNNSMFSRRACLSVEGPFEPRLNSVGGEDSLFLQHLVLAGRRFAWAAEAGIVEWVPPKRMSWRYIQRRKFLSGQIRTFVHTMVDPPRRTQVLAWMAVGAAQAALAGSAAALLLPVRRAASRRLAATAAGGLGKVLWGRRFRPSLYGHGLVS